MVVPPVEMRSTHCQSCFKPLDETGACSNSGCLEAREFDAEMCDQLAIQALDSDDQVEAAKWKRAAAWHRNQAGRAAPLFPSEQLELRLLQTLSPAEAGFIHLEMSAMWDEIYNALPRRTTGRTSTTFEPSTHHIEAFKVEMKRYMRKRKPFTWRLHYRYLAAEFVNDMEKHRDRWKNSELVKQWENRERWGTS